ncbi:MAG: cobalt chelatase [Acidimicrobiales bacterium]|nr:cobalt chelatase [Acidimicrobiales bacterium]RZV48187.1 MAG: cobalt chelatase [Acidimicrobiales bacterium]
MNAAEQTVSRRARERRAAATLRAVGAEPTAEFRAQQLRVNERPVSVATPYLLVDLDDAERIRHRGVVDALGVRLRYSDRRLHDELSPHDLIARLVFDLLEQLRCEALVPDELAGVRNNIEQAFRDWNREERLTNTALGLLVYTLLHMARSRLVHPLQNELIEDTIDATRANISRFIGEPLKELKPNISSQADFAAPARQLAEAVAMLVESDERGGTEVVDRVAAQLFIPPEWGDTDGADDGEIPTLGNELAADRVDERSLDEVGGYHVFTRVHDREIDAASLYPLDTRRDLRERLDELIAEQAVSVFSLARRLQKVLVGVEEDGWRVGQEEGVLDAHRLPQLIANPQDHHVFRRERFRVTSPAVVSFLIDNSGSMKRQRHETVTVLVDTLARALDLAGATSEILGFTTGAWNGGEPLREWRRAGEEPNPGRLAELSHIVYKSADEPWKRSRLAIASMMKTQHFREGVDGEAITWAYRRLLARPEPRKLLVVVSDGAPMEAATMNANGEAFLEAHLRNVSMKIARERQVELGAIAIDLPVSEFFKRSVEMDLTGTLTLADYRFLETMFGPHRRL